MSFVEKRVQKIHIAKSDDPTVQEAPPSPGSISTVSNLVLYSFCQIGCAVLNQSLFYGYGKKYCLSLKLN